MITIPLKEYKKEDFPCVVKWYHDILKKYLYNIYGLSNNEILRSRQYGSQWSDSICYFEKGYITQLSGEEMMLIMDFLGYKINKIYVQ